MQELLTQVIHEVRSALRYRWYGLLVMWVVCLGGWAWAAMQPDVYQANARVFVDTSSILQPVLGNRMFSSNVDAELAYIREALLGRPQMEIVARETGLDSAATTDDALEAVISGLQSSIQIQAVRAGRTRNSSDGVYSINYRHSERDKAVAVVDAVLNRFVESTLGANRLQGDTAERFLEERLAEYEERLAAAEEERAQFQKENAGRLPGNQGGYFARMRAEQDGLDKAQGDLRILQSKRVALEAQLRGEGGNVPPGGTPEVLDPVPNSLDARIQDYEARLDSLLLQFTERHPDVIAVRDTLDRLKEQRAEQLAALGLDESSGELLSYEGNPILQATQMAVNNTDIEIATLQAEILERTDRVNELQGLIDEVPEVEARLARLNRDYQVIYEQYLALVRSRETQELTRKASDTDQIDFRIINPPRAAPTPVAPDRLALIAMVFAAAVAAGVGVCYLLAQLSPVFSNGTSLRQYAGLPLLGVVTHAWPEQRRVAQRRATAAYAVALAALVTAFAGLAGVELLGPGIHQFVSG